MLPSAKQSLFTPLRIGTLNLGHRVVMAPLTRSRAVQPDSIPGDLMAQYYTQRASEGGLIITEATNISLLSRGWLGAPGLYSEEQVSGWKKVVAGVHQKGGRIFAQLWHTGRSSHVSLTGGATPASASVDPEYWEHPSHLVSIVGGWVQPSPHRAFTLAEIRALIEDYRRAAERALQAGFDGVELHAANGYLIDQFLQDGSNKRKDQYGGSIENRSRLLFDALEALIAACGSNRVAVRIGPGGAFNGMSDSDPAALFSYVATKLNSFDLAYLHIIEPRVKGSVTDPGDHQPVATAQIRALYSGTLIAAGGFEPDTADALVARGAVDAIAFGRYFVSNPDLPYRIQAGLPLSKYDRNTFYTFDAQGYTDYPFYQGSVKLENVDHETVNPQLNQEQGTIMSNKVNVMLVHGAWADGSCWSKVIPLLEAKGLNVTAAQIPLTSLDDDIAVTRRLLSMDAEPTVLVGHSYGGAVISGAATATPNVKALVYITAFGLDEGESLEGLSKQGRRRCHARQSRPGLEDDSLLVSRVDR